MTIKYSATTDGFYDDAIHKSIPGDAVTVSAEEHAALMAGQSAGSSIVAVNGRPTIAQPSKAEIDAEQVAQAKRRLVEIDIASTRAIREWLAARPDAPQFVKNHEASAVAERSKIK